MAERAGEPGSQAASAAPQSASLGSDLLRGGSCPDCLSETGLPAAPVTILFSSVWLVASSPAPPFFLLSLLRWRIMINHGSVFS